MKNVYSSDPVLRHPRQFGGKLLLDLRVSRRLAWRLFVHNLRAQYRKSVLGYVWVLLPPLVTTLLWVFLNNTRILPVGATDIPYPIYVLIGTLLWQTFVDCINSPLRQLDGYRNIVTRIGTPWEALILAGLGEVIFNFVIRLSLLLITLIWYRFVIPPSALLAPIGLLSLLIVGLSIGLLLLPAGLLFQDIQRGLGIATSIWFFLTPIVYAPPANGIAHVLVRLNPVTPPIVAIREMLTRGLPADAGSFWVVSVLALLLLLITWILYRLAMPHLVARMPA